MTNFEFLKNINKNLYDIINDAEKLYVSQFFEQCITQTRRFGEQICKTIMEEQKLVTGNFDDMIATLKDKATYQHEKEFIEDLYFLKKQGNNTVHSSSVTKNSRLALECLQRAFEIAISYSVYYKNENKNILKKNYDIGKLVSLSESIEKIYLDNINKFIKNDKKNSKKIKKSLKEKQSYSMKPYTNNNKDKYFWIFVFISFILSLLLLLINSLI